MGVVRFWRGTEVKPVDDPPTSVTYEPPPKPVSLDELVAEIRHCRAREIHLQGEIHRAELATEKATDRLVAELKKLDGELMMFRRMTDE